MSLKATTRSDIDFENRTIKNVSFASDAIIDDGFQKISLVHDDGALDLSRAVDGALPLMDNHYKGRLGIIRNIRIEDGKTRGDVTFSQRPEAMAILRDIDDGLLSETSIRAAIKDYRIEDEVIYATRWQPSEGSFVDIPADVSVGVNRSHNSEGSEMLRRKHILQNQAGEDGGGGSAAPAAPVTPPGSGDVNALSESLIERGKQQGKEEVQRTLVEQQNIFAQFGHLERSIGKEKFDALRQAAIANVWSGDVVRTQLLNALQNQPASYETPASQQNDDVVERRNGYGDTTVVRTAKQNFCTEVERALNVHVGNITDKEEKRKARETGLMGMSMSEVAREYLRIAGKPSRGSRESVLGEAFIIRSGHGSEDFTAVLENVANKSMINGFEEQPESWSRYCRRGNLSDFKPTTRPKLGSFGSLDEVGQYGELKHKTVGDSKEQLQAKQFGNKFGISRKALVNDDLSALGAIPRSMGRGASRTVGDAVMAVLIGNPTLLEDATALFHANHSNFVANGSGAAPSTATLGAAWTAIGTQKDINSNAHASNATPKFILVPKALEISTWAILNSILNPAEGTTTSFREQNFFQGPGKLEVIPDGRLDNGFTYRGTAYAADAAKWFVLCDPNIYDTIEVGFVDGREEPYLEQQNNWDSLGVEYRCWIEFDAGPLDYRFMYHNDGN